MTVSPQPSETDRTIDAVARRVVHRHAPAELPHYEHIRDDFHARGGVPPPVGENPLGFGSVAVGLVSGVVLAVLTDLAAGTLADVVRPWWQRAGRWLLRRVGLARPVTPPPQAPAPTVPPERVAAVTRAITAYAVQSGIPAEQAGELAEAVVSELM
ncbi:hypothetical protein RIF23_10550 [Lipingzhangella sp. LS1_29]|uniref:Uncharacterized protein n=1 Tax=Lipingzhangella rawalii TaxID=2055835 RepID=A0ABU2H820_9ACTN|nr:hypothetical protein [Lipingzhangella rawalii]MDS1270739.1 hypothetical protein [Lipingzhangella rawalii]